MGFAKGKYAFGFCDRCDFRYPLKDLKMEYVNGAPQHNRVCPSCWDSDHPQNFLWKVKTDDDQALKDPRPDQGQEASRRLYAWNPVGYHQATSEVRGLVGTVTVVTS